MSDFYISSTKSSQLHFITFSLHSDARKVGSLFVCYRNNHRLLTLPKWPAITPIPPISPMHPHQSPSKCKNVPHVSPHSEVAHPRNPPPPAGPPIHQSATAIPSIQSSPIPLLHSRPHPRLHPRLHSKAHPLFNQITMNHLPLNLLTPRTIRTITGAIMNMHSSSSGSLRL